MFKGVMTPESPEHFTSFFAIGAFVWHGNAVRGCANQPSVVPIPAVTASCIGKCDTAAAFGVYHVVADLYSHVLQVVGT